MGIISQIVNSFIFWGAWIIIPVLMEIVPAFGSMFLLIKRRLKHAKGKQEMEYYPEISLIIPVYNSADTLYACIQSVHRSNYPIDRIRIFLVNNQGQDDSFDVYAKCQQRYPKLRMQWLNAQQGKSKALNLALYNSEGKYIINLDSDGTLEANALYNMVRKFESNPDLNCMTGAILTNPAKIKMHKRLRSRILRKLEFMEYAQAFLAGRSYASEIDAVYTLSGAFSAFRKSAILKSRLYNTDTICEDTQVTFQMRYIYKEKVEVCEDAIFFVDPIENMNKLYTQRQRWQRGSLEVAKMFMDEKFIISKAFTDINVKTMLYDHTFAFPRLIWYLALFCLMSMNYSAKAILLSLMILFSLYILVGFFYYGVALYFLRHIPTIRKYYRNHWWCIFLLPFFNLMVFFIRMAGIINSIQTDSSWYTRNLTEEKRAFEEAVWEDLKKPYYVLRMLRRKVNVWRREVKTKSKIYSVGWHYIVGTVVAFALLGVLLYLNQQYGLLDYIKTSHYIRITFDGLL